MSKLVVYFSYSGVTAEKAKAIAKEHGADIFEIQAEVPYTDDDVNWRDNSSRNVKEHKDVKSRPAIVSMPDLTGVDEMWIGYPIWWYTHPRIINTFFDQAELSEIKVHLFATSGGTGIQGSMDELRKTYPDVDIVDEKKL